MKTIEVQTKLGKIKGYTENGVNYFRGVPYAKTPRFKSPESFEFENGFFDATNDEVECPQPATYHDNNPHDFYCHEYFNPNKVYKYDESYMTLNIIAPEDKTNCDTLIFIHGGSFILGCQSDLPFGLSSVYAKNDIILVNVSYRLNVFSSFNSLNLGLQDIVYAINWVKDNIEAFGGSKRITLAGQSAGAFLIQDLLYSHKLDGIVNGAIMMSGGGALPYFFGPGRSDRYQKFFDSFVTSLGFTNPEDLDKLSTEELYLKYESFNKKKHKFLSYLPQVDNDIISDYPKNLIKNHDTLDIPIIFGITKNDMFPPVLFMMAKRYAKYHYNNKMSNTYMYFFERESPGDNAKAFHSCDLAYAFGLDNIWRPWQNIDYKISEQLITYFSNFIHNGNPNSSVLPKWLEAYPSKSMKLFNEELTNMISIKNAKKQASFFSYFPKLESEKKA